MAVFFNQGLSGGKIGNSCGLLKATLKDKKKMINNFAQCQELFYNFARQHNWIDTSNINYDFWNKKNI